MKKFALLALLVPFIGFSAVEPVVISLLVGDSYTVPANKVLVIESVSSFDSSTEYGSCWIEIVSNGSTNGPILITPNASASIATYDKSLKIPAGSIITRSNLGYPLTSTLTMFCLLVDYSELYASIESQTDGYLAQNNVFSFDVNTASARPMRIFTEGTSGLTTGWEPVDATIERKNSGTYTVAIATDSDSYFAKYAVRSRE